MCLNLIGHKKNFGSNEPWDIGILWEPVLYWYLSHRKRNGSASFRVTIQLTNFLLFFLLFLHVFSLISHFLELEYNTLVLENCIESRIHTYSSYVRTLNTAKKWSCDFSCYDSTNSFPSLFSRIKYITLWC